MVCSFNVSWSLGHHLPGQQCRDMCISRRAQTQKYGRTQATLHLGKTTESDAMNVVRRKPGRAKVAVNWRETQHAGHELIQ